jgi:hypothetical protein
MGDLAKAALDNVEQGLVVEMVVVDLSAEEELALGHELVVELPIARARVFGLLGLLGLLRVGIRVAGARYALVVPVTGMYG